MVTKEDIHLNEKHNGKRNVSLRRQYNQILSAGGKPLKYTIYIPSKGRPNCSTPKLLGNTKYYLVVEPQDKKAYIDNFGKNKVLVLNKNNKGLWYARKWIKKYSTKKSEKFHWQIDDDIRAFMKRDVKLQKNKRRTAYSVLGHIENYVQRYKNIGMAGLKSEAFAWGAKRDLDFNKQIAGVALLNNKVKVSYRDNVIEDTDYSMQVLSAGGDYCTVLFNRLILSTVKLGSNEGGHQSSNDYLKRAKGLIKKWPQHFKIKERSSDGVKRIAPSSVWRHFTQRPIKKTRKN
jgi:hypothetical protein